MKWRIFNDDDPFFCNVFGHKWGVTTDELSTCSRCDAARRHVVVNVCGKKRFATVIARKGRPEW